MSVAVTTLNCIEKRLEILAQFIKLARKAMEAQVPPIRHGG
jgi:hypothetical protein